MRIHLKPSGYRRRALFDRIDPTDSGSAVVSNDRYFDHLEAIVLTLFNRQPDRDPPKYIADLRCGDGKLLKRLYKIIQVKTLREEKGTPYPVRLIGVDPDGDNRNKAVENLKAFDPVILKGDIQNPELMIENLANAGIRDTDNILYIHHFTDFRGSEVLPPENPVDTAGSDRPTGDAADTAAFKDLEARFIRWSACIGRHGLVLLETHDSDREPDQTPGGRNRGVNADRAYRFSNPSAVTADAFLDAAASAGLFPNPDCFKKYPPALPLSLTTLNLFERRTYRIRNARADDLPALMDLEEKCWAEGLRSSFRTIQERLKKYPEGQLVLEVNNRVAGVIYSQRLDHFEALGKASTDTVDGLHRKDGNIIQLIAINILPEVQEQKLGDQLLEHMLQRCALTDGVATVLAVTRCKNYRRQEERSFRDYIRTRNGQGTLSDPVLRFHELHGAKVETVIDDYRPADTENEGFGVLVSYDIQNRTRNEIQIHASGAGKKTRLG